DRSSCVLLDPVDLDVGKPERSPCPALDDAAVEAAAEPDREIGAARSLDRFRLPAEQPRIERTRGGLISGVELEMHEPARLRILHTRSDPAAMRNPSALQCRGCGRWIPRFPRVTTSRRRNVAPHRTQRSRDEHTNEQ